MTYTARFLTDQCAAVFIKNWKVLWFIGQQFLNRQTNVGAAHKVPLVLPAAHCTTMPTTLKKLATTIHIQAEPTVGGDQAVWPYSVPKSGEVLETKVKQFQILL